MGALAGKIVLDLVTDPLTNPLDADREEVLIEGFLHDPGTFLVPCTGSITETI